MNKLFEWFGQPFEQMSKTDNVEQTGRLFERMKILLICTTGSIPSAWLDQGIGNVVVYFFFISFVVVVNFKAFILTIKNGDYFNLSLK